MFDTSSALYQIASLPAAGRDPEALLSAILQQTCAALGADAAVLFQVDEQGGGFTPAAAHGAALSSVGRLSFSASAAVLGTAVSRRQPLPLPAGDPVALGLGLGAAVYAPAFGGDGLVGVLLLGRRAGQPFEAEALPLLHSGPLTPQQQAVLESVSRASDRMVALISDLLDVAQIESGLELRRRPADLAALMRGVAQEQAAVAVARGITVQLDLPPGLPPALADPPRIEQVLTNLLSNAIKYTPPGGEVRVSATAGEKQVRLSVHDTGIGIGPADLPRVFDRFFRVRSEQTTRVEGTGLGLSIVKSIVERHGGSVKAESEGVPGKGSTFSFTLPQAAG